MTARNTNGNDTNIIAAATSARLADNPIRRRTRNNNARQTGSKQSCRIDAVTSVRGKSGVSRHAIDKYSGNIGGYFVAYGCPGKFGCRYPSPAARDFAVTM